jgi:hypothetical protein
MDSLVSPKNIIIDACIGWLEISSLNELSPCKDEVDTIFTLPLRFFLENSPEKYHTRFLFHSYKLHDDGSKEVLFPAQELGIPSMYHDSWGETLHDIYVYKTDHGPLWGFTAEFMVELVETLTH